MTGFQQRKLVAVEAEKLKSNFLDIQLAGGIELYISLLFVLFWGISRNRDQKDG